MRRIVLAINLFLTLLLFVGCLKKEKPPVRLSFWTDLTVDSVSMNLLYANETLVGAFESSVLDPICGESGLLNFDLVQEGELELTIRDEDGNRKLLGSIDLFSVSTGITVRPAVDATIHVYLGLDEPCTLVQLRW